MLDSKLKVENFFLYDIFFWSNHLKVISAGLSFRMKNHKKAGGKAQFKAKKTVIMIFSPNMLIFK